MLYVVLALTIIGLTSIYINYLFLNDIINNNISEDNEISSLTQSETHMLNLDYDKSFRQTNEEQDKFVRVAIYNGNAYWVNQEGLQWAPLDEEEEVQYSLQEQVDVHNMTQKEVDVLLEILDALKEDRYEGGSTG